jgi:hypothetical protein
LEGDGGVTAEAFEAVKGVHEEAHEKCAGAEAEEGAEDPERGVFEGEGFVPQGAMGGEELIGGHGTGLKRHVVSVVELPAAVWKDAALPGKLFEGGSARVGCQNTEKGDVDARFVELAGHGADGFGRVAVEAGDKAGHDADATPVEGAYARFVVGCLVLRLVGVTQRLGPEGLDPEEDANAA